LWKRHFGLLVFIAILVYIFGWYQLGAASSIRTTIICWLFVVTLMVLYPQMMFKPQSRLLIIDSDGLDTVIGTRRAKRTWGDIRSVADDGGYIIITGTNGNAFVVPPRAFPSPTARASFLSFAQRSVAARQGGVD